jgi:hypothetical protein
MPGMTVTGRDEDVRKLVLLVIEIGELRVRLSQARTILAPGVPSDGDSNTAELIEDAGESERDLASIISSLSRRLRAPRATTDLLTRPLNKYEEAHLDLARAHAEELNARLAGLEDRP